MRTRNDKLNGRVRERRELEGKKTKWIGWNKKEPNKKEPEGVKTKSVYHCGENSCNLRNVSGGCCS